MNKDIEMSRAERRAMEVYPPRMAYNSMVSVALKEKRDINSNNRQKFIQGYVTAEGDILQKLEQMMCSSNGGDYIRGVYDLVQELKGKRDE